MSIPKMRFYGYDSSWKVSKLGELFEIYSGNTPSRSDRNNYDNGTIPWIKTTDLNNSLIYVNEEKITDHGAKKLKTLPKNTILIAMYGGFNQIGRTGLLTYPATINQALASLLPVKEINSYFLLNYLNLRKDSWRNVAASSRKDPNITKNDVEKFKISFPSIEEQSAIGSLFRILDDLLASYKDNLANYQSLKATMLSKMFPKAGQTIPEIRLDGFTGAWKFSSIGEQADITKLAGFEFTKHVVYSDEGEIPAIRGLNVKNQKINLSDVKYIDRSDFSKLNRSKLNENDLLFTYVGTVGEVARVPENVLWYLAPNVSRIRLNRTLDSRFVLYQMTSNRFKQKQISPLIATSSQPALSMSNIRKFIVSFTTIEEQQAIGDYFSNLDQLITFYQEKITQLETLKKKLLQDMFI